LGDLLEDRDWQRASKGLVRLALNGNLDVADIELLFLAVGLIGREACILFEDFGLLEYLCGVVMHKLKKLIYHVFLIVLDAFTGLIGVNISYPAFQGVFQWLGPARVLPL
jgi:hypothetical protein